MTSVRVREIPLGSGINGRPILDDRHWHLARYETANREGWDRDGWVTYCGQPVPEDHMCPPRGQTMPSTECLDCDAAYRNRDVR